MRSHGNVLPESIVLFGEVCRKKAVRGGGQKKKRKTSLALRSPSPRPRLVDRRICQRGRHRQYQTIVLLRRWPSLLGRCMCDLLLTGLRLHRQRGLVVRQRVTSIDYHIWQGSKHGAPSWRGPQYANPSPLGRKHRGCLPAGSPTHHFEGTSMDVC